MPPKVFHEFLAFPALLTAVVGVGDGLTSPAAAADAPPLNPAAAAIAPPSAHAIAPTQGPSNGSPDQPPIAIAQVQGPPNGSPAVDLPGVAPQDLLPPDRLPEEDLPEQPLPPLPSLDDLLQPSSEPTLPPSDTGEVPDTIRVERYEVVGSTVFSAAELAAVTQPYTGEVSFAELLQARSAVTQLYTSAGYITSGAFIPPQTLDANTVVIQVVEGQLEEINVTGTQRLNRRYISSRLARAGATPLNVNRLLEGLQLLQIDPLLQSLSAELAAGVRPGTSVLNVAVVEADPFRAELTLDNGRSPSVGSIRRQVDLTHANLLGMGDGLSIGYTNTDGSNGVDGRYTLPINPRNGTLSVALGLTESEVIEDPFNALDIQARSRYYELTLRQPLYQTPSEELALGLTASHQTSRTELGLDDIGGFPLSPGADAEGRTRVTALRFFQEWTQRSSRHVLAGRSQFSLGLDALNATVNDNGPDSRFFAWRGQGQWVRLLAPDTLLLLRTDLQFSDGDLLPLEQFGLGGQTSIRGYRQDLLLTDNGILASAEVRIPVLRVPDIDGLLQVVPFLDIGTGWNASAPDPDPETLVGLGLGLRWQQGENFNARLDWGIPLVGVESNGNTLQEDGIYFSLSYSPF